MVPFVSIILPTLGREKELQRCLDSIDQLIWPKDRIETLVLDHPERTVPMKVHMGLEMALGEIICYAANDCEFTPLSLNWAVNPCMRNKSLVAFNTGRVSPSKGNICEHFVIHRELIQQIGGYIFDLDFHHVGVDNLLWAQAEALGKAERSDLAVLKHYHFSKPGGLPMDEVYTRGWSKTHQDRKTLAAKLELLKLYGPTLKPPLTE